MNTEPLQDINTHSEIPKQSEKNISSTTENPYKIDTYELYKVWKLLPSFFKYPPKDKKTKETIDPKEFMLSMGIEDEKVLSLAGIQTQGDFARAHGVSQDTLTDWNKTLFSDGSLDDIRHWSVPLSKNVLMSMYTRILKTGDPLAAKLWFQVVEKWQEKLSVEHKFVPIKHVTHKVLTLDEHGRIIRDTKPEPIAIGGGDTVGKNTETGTGVPVPH